MKILLNFSSNREYTQIFFFNYWLFAVLFRKRGVYAERGNK